MLLNCTSSTTTINALAEAASASPSEVLAAVCAVTYDELAASGDPIRALPGLAAERLGLEAITGFSHVRYFHGSRTLNLLAIYGSGCCLCPTCSRAFGTGCDVSAPTYCRRVSSVSFASH